MFLKKECSFYFNFAMSNFWLLFFFSLLMQGRSYSCSLTNGAETENNEENSIILGPCKMATEVTTCSVP